MSAPKRTEVEEVQTSAAQRPFISTRERSRRVRITKALVVPVGAFIIWATITNLSLVEPIFLPTPQKIVRVFWAIREVIPAPSGSRFGWWRPVCYSAASRGWVLDWPSDTASGPATCSSSLLTPCDRYPFLR